MRTEPVETYRGLLIFEDTPKDRASGKVRGFRCTANGRQLKAETLAAIKALIDRDQTRGRSD
jgi:hypothetical protein